MKKNLKTLKATILVFAFVCTTSLMAQGPGGFDDNVEDNNSGVPLDGGIAVLIIGAAAFGIKKLRDNTKK
jgi:hypothetical protein